MIKIKDRAVARPLLSRSTLDKITFIYILCVCCYGPSLFDNYRLSTFVLLCCSPAVVLCVLYVNNTPTMIIKITYKKDGKIMEIKLKEKIRLVKQLHAQLRPKKLMRIYSVYDLDCLYEGRAQYMPIEFKYLTVANYKLENDYIIIYVR